MTATVADNALLLAVLARPDGLDPRQVNVKTATYTNALTGDDLESAEDLAPLADPLLARRPLRSLVVVENR